MAECNCQICLARSGKGQEMMVAEAMEKVKKDEALKQQQYAQKLQLAKQQLKKLSPTNTFEIFEIGWIQAPLSIAKNTYFEQYIFTSATDIATSAIVGGTLGGIYGSGLTKILTEKLYEVIFE